MTNPDLLNEASGDPAKQGRQGLGEIPDQSKTSSLNKRREAGAAAGSSLASPFQNPVLTTSEPYHGLIVRVVLR